MVKDKKVTVIEAKKNVEKHEIALLEAKRDLENAIQTEKNYDLLKANYTALENKVVKLEEKISKLNKTKGIKDIKTIEKWRDMVHDHLDGHESMNEEDLENLFQDLKGIAGEG
jgi:hypothetical protein